MSNPTAALFPPFTAKIDFSKEIDRAAVKGQSVLVTGGANGIGQGFVEALAECGAYVTMFDIQQEKGEEIAKTLNDKGFKVQFVQGDVRSWDDQVKAFDAAVSFSPSNSLDIVLAVAGVGGQSILTWLDDSTSPDGKLVKPDTKVIDINLTAVWYTTHLALHYFRQSLKRETDTAGSKQIVFVSSMAGYTSNTYVTSYGAAKWGVRGIWRSIRGGDEVLGKGTKGRFRSSLIAPWFVKTDMTADVKESFEKMGFKFAEVDDCVDGMLRIVCDEEVKGRAVAIVPDKKSFDMCDDFEGYDAGREWVQKMTEGTFGSSFETLRPFFSGGSTRPPKPPLGE